MTKLLRGLSALPQGMTVVTSIGKFDGLHLGHQLILKALEDSKLQNQAKSLVIAFYYNPACYFNPKLEKKRIISLKDQLKILSDFSVDYLLLLRFNSKLANLSADDFVEQILLVKLNIQELIVGEDAVIGKDRQGTVNFLKKKFAKLKRKITVCNFISQDSRKVSSSALRKAIIEGEFNTYQGLTNREYSISGKVISGQGLARTLGFPTANIKYSDLYLPPNGVYATEVLLAGNKYRAITNLGFRPTISSLNKRQKIETYLLDYQGQDFYGQSIEVRFKSFIRSEYKFPTLQDLTAQIKRDLENRRKLS